MMTNPKIRFTLNGRVLIYENAPEVQFWYLQDRRRLHQHDGHLIGISRNGQSFLLESPDNTIQIRDTRTGIPIPLDSISTEDYAPGQRCVVRPKGKLIEVIDVVRGESISAIETSANACLSHDGSFILATIEGDSIWGEWARGYCLHLDGRVYFEFSVSPNANQSILQTTTGGSYLLDQYTIWDIQAGKSERIYPIVANQYARHFIAVNTAETPPIFAVHESGNQTVLYQAGLELITLTMQANIHYGAFYPDNRHIALLLENNEIVFCDWRLNRQKASLHVL